ncbi:MAG: LURP-one-related/scramblase family protein [Bacillota bacterium]
MTTFYMRQKVFSLGEKFTITDQNEQPKYTVQGSFMQIPKQFTIYDQTNEAVGTITKKMISLLPAFYVSVDGFKEIMIQKAFTFFKTRFDIHAENIHIVGDIFDKYFEVHGPRGVIAYVEEKWFTWGDTYTIDVADEQYEALVISLIVAIDFAKAQDN